MEFDIEALHEWCGRECSRQAWELWRRGRVDPVEAEKMLGLALAAQWHWSHAGAAIDEIRGFILMGYAHLKVGQPQRALKDVQALQALLEDDSTAAESLRDHLFEFACIVAIIARAMDALGRDRGNTHRADAQLAGEQIESDELRQYFFDSLLNYAPWKSPAGG